MSRGLEMAGILLRSSWQGLRGAGLTGWIAVATIATALFMLGAFALVVVNMERRDSDTSNVVGDVNRAVG